MARKRWTIVLLGEEEGGPLHRLSLTPRRLRALAAGVGIALLAGIVFLGSVGFDGAARVEAKLLKERNAVLAEELTRIHSRVAGLEKELSLLGEKDAEARLLAGLAPLDEEVLRVGVGGPGSGTPEEHPLSGMDPELGNTAFAIDYDLGAMERRIGLFRESLAEALDSLEAHRELLDATPSILPTTGLLRSGFSNARLHPILNRTTPHEGIDLSAPRGTPIMAAAKGRILTAGWQSGYGQTVIIDHGHGFRTLYGHADKLLVRVGQVVERGEIVAQVGSSGLATSPHLHYEVRVNGRPVNPMNYILTGPVP